MTENSIEKEAEAFVSEEKEVKNVKEAIAGATVSYTHLSSMRSTLY